MPQISIKVKTNWLKTLFVVIFASVLTLILIGQLIEIIRQPSEINSMVFLWLIMIAIAILLWNAVFWDLFGQVILLNEKEMIEIKNENTLFKNRIRIKRQKVISINYSKDEDLLIRAYGFSHGDIIFKYFKGQRRLGKGLTENECNILIEDIRNMLEISGN